MSETTVLEQLGKYGKWMATQSPGSLIAGGDEASDPDLTEIEFLDLGASAPSSPGLAASLADFDDTGGPVVDSVLASGFRSAGDSADTHGLSSLASATTISTSERVTVGKPARLKRMLALAAGLVLLVGGGLFLRDGEGSGVDGVDSADQQGSDVEDAGAIDFEQAESGQPIDVSELSAEQQRFVLEGEIVLSGNPLIVSAPLGPEPLFDTSDLGTEVVFEPLLQVTAETKPIIVGSLFGPYNEDQTLTKATLLGTIDGEPWVRTVHDGPNVEEFGGAGVDANARSVFLSSTFGGGGSGDLAEVDSLDMIEQPTIDDFEGLVIGGYVAPTGWVQTQVLPAGTSVVTFVDADTRVWMRPRGGVAVFFAEFDEGERFTLEALDATGQVIASASEVIRYANDSVSTNPQPGDEFGVLHGIDLEIGEAVSIGDTKSGSDVVSSSAAPQANRPVLLVYGAEWCVPCGEGLSDLINILGGWDDVADVYSVPHYVESGERWPLDSSWAYPQFDPDNSSGPASVGYVPAVLVLDADGTVLDLISGLDGWDDLDDRLREHLGS